ncbi:hypothetical protein [Glutamicibacter sp.]|jgi:hypothetical protein|uniref:hypothetical protein n=1 Tax=Glutamicibacter sp. TaxID=1931995 RepID=UPI002FDB87EA
MPGFFPQDPDEATVAPVEPKPNPFQRDRFSGRLKLGRQPFAPVKPTIPPQDEFVTRRANASKSVIDAVDDYLESLGGLGDFKNYPQTVPDEKGGLISLRAKIIRNPEKAAFILEQAHSGADRTNPFFKKVEDTARAYSQAVASPAEQMMRGQLQTRTQSLTAEKQKGLAGLRAEQEARTPISGREAEEKNKTLGGIILQQNLLNKQVPKPPETPNEKILRENPAFMVGPQAGIKLPAQDNLRQHVEESIKDAMFQTGMNAPQSMDEFAVEVAGDLGLNQQEVYRTLRSGATVNPEAHRQKFGAADASKSDDLTRFLLMALAFGPQQAYRIVMGERQERRQAAREQARDDRSAYTTGIQERRLDLAERNAAATQGRFEQREARITEQEKVRVLQRANDAIMRTSNKELRDKLSARRNEFSRNMQFSNAAMMAGKFKERDAYMALAKAASEEIDRLTAPTGE